MQKTRMKFLPMHPTSSRNGYNLDDRVMYNREPTTLRALHERGLLIPHERPVRKPTARGEMSIIERQFLVSTRPGSGMHQQWVITEEAYREVHPFQWSEDEGGDDDSSGS